jgi:hypothetical protein
MIVADKHLKCGRRAIKLKDKSLKNKLSFIFENLNREFYVNYMPIMVCKIQVIKIP